MVGGGSEHQGSGASAQADRRDEERKDERKDLVQDAGRIAVQHVASHGSEHDGTDERGAVDGKPWKQQEESPAPQRCRQ